MVISSSIWWWHWCYYIIYSSIPDACYYAQSFVIVLSLIQNISWFVSWFSFPFFCYHQLLFTFFFLLHFYFHLPGLFVVMDLMLNYLALNVDVDVQLDQVIIDHSHCCSFWLTQGLGYKCQTHLWYK